MSPPDLRPIESEKNKVLGETVTSLRIPMQEAYYKNARIW